MSETYDQMLRDSDMLFTQISTSAAISYKEAQEMIVGLYVPDMTISRSGISHALKRLERHYTHNKSAAL